MLTVKETRQLVAQLQAQENRRATNQGVVRSYVDRPVVSLAASAGGTVSSPAVWGFVVGGSGNLYRVALVEAVGGALPTHPPWSATVTTCVVPNLSPAEMLPPGTWLLLGAAV